eukprot:scaffold609_cov130-Cylindrotheca_fusiformis.AAC.13
MAQAPSQQVTPSTGEEEGDDGDDLESPPISTNNGNNEHDYNDEEASGQERSTRIEADDKSKNRIRDERHIKRRARSSDDNEPSLPGAHYSSTSSSRGRHHYRSKRKDADGNSRGSNNSAGTSSTKRSSRVPRSKRRDTNAPMSPGAHHRSSGRDSRLARSKREGKPGAKMAGPDDHRSKEGHHKYNHNKKTTGVAAAAAPAAGASVNGEEITVNAVAVDEEQEKHEAEERLKAQLLERQLELTQPQDDSILVATLPVLEEKKEDDGSSRKRRLVAFLTCCCCVLILAIALGIIFGLRSSSETTSTSRDTVTDDNDGNRTTVPTGSLDSFPPSSSPTEKVCLFDPPTPNQCHRIANGTEVEGQEDMLVRNFQVGLDIGIDDDFDVDVVALDLQKVIQSYFIPDLAGCERNSTTESSRSVVCGQQHRETDACPFAVANGVSTVLVSGDTGSECDEGIPNCIRAIAVLDLYLKGSQRIFELIEMLTSILHQETLLECWNLTAGYESIVLTSVGSGDITPAPSSVPTGLPSASPTFQPSQLPSEVPPTTSRPTGYVSPTVPNKEPTTPPPTPGPTPSPTAPPNLDPTPPPTKLPTLEPSPPPTTNPTPPPTPRPTPSPTAPPNPDPTPPPTKQPTRSPTPPPTPEPTPPPTRHPTSYPTPKQTKTPTTPPTPHPTPSPTSPPNPDPTPPPTRQPTKDPTPPPTPDPTPPPTRSPTRDPTPPPTPDPTPPPTRSPTRDPTPPPTPGPTPPPTRNPTPPPTPKPTPLPTRKPTSDPTPQPSPEPSPLPTRRPTRDPTPQPTPVPTPLPTPIPTRNPTPPPSPKPTPPPTQQQKDYSCGPGNGVCECGDRRYCDPNLNMCVSQSSYDRSTPYDCPVRVKCVTGSDGRKYSEIRSRQDPEECLTVERDEMEFDDCDGDNPLQFWSYDPDTKELRNMEGDDSCMSINSRNDELTIGSCSGQNLPWTYNTRMATISPLFGAANRCMTEDHHDTEVDECDDEDEDQLMNFAFDECR